MRKDKLSLMSLWGASRCSCCQQHGETVYFKPWSRPARLCPIHQAELHDAMTGSPAWEAYLPAHLAVDALAADWLKRHAVAEESKP